MKSKQSDGTGKKEKVTNKILAGLDSMVTTISKIMDLDAKETEEVPVVVDRDEAVDKKKIEDLPLKELLMLSKEYKDQMKILVEMDLITPEEKKKLKDNIMYVFSIIDSRRGGEKRSYDQIS